MSIGNKLAPVAIASLLDFQDIGTDPVSTGNPGLMRIDSQVYFRDLDGVLWPLVPGADGAGVVTVTHAMTPYAALATDRIFLVDTSAGVVTVTLYGTPIKGQPALFVDAARSFAVHNLTIGGGGHNINGAATLVVSVIDTCPSLTYGGTTWETSPGASGIVPLTDGGTGADLSAGTANTTTVLLTNDVATGGTAKAFALNNTVDLVTAGAKIIDFQSAGASKAAVLGGGGILAPTLGPNATQQHTSPAVASGTYLVSGASSITDVALQLGDGTHRLNGLATQAITSGASTLAIQATVADGASGVGVAISNNINLQTGGAAVATFGTTAAGLLYVGAASGSVDALCYAEVLTCSGTVTAGQVVVWTGTKLVAAAAASAGLTTIAGVALTGGTGVSIIVARRGRCYVNADAGSTVGQLLKTSGAVAGNVVNGGTAVGSIVGRACESSGATTAGKILTDLSLS